MKRHPGWLAAGLLLFAVLACNLSKNSNNSNQSSNSSTSNRPANAEVYVDRISMAKDDNGQPGDETASFAPGDHIVHCVIYLNKAKAGTAIKFSWLAVNAEGMPKNDLIKSIDYTTNSFENKVHGHLTLPKDWPKGSYKVEVYINGALDKTIEYSVE